MENSAIGRARECVILLTLLNSPVLSSDDRPKPGQYLGLAQRFPYLLDLRRTLRSLIYRLCSARMRRLAFESADHYEADRTLDRAGAARV